MPASIKELDTNKSPQSGRFLIRPFVAGFAVTGDIMTSCALDRFHDLCLAHFVFRNILDIHEFD
jgi:hypothetical protein